LGKSNGKLIIGTLGISGSSSKMLNGAAGVIFDSIGSIYVADSNNHRIKLFLVGQSSGITIAGVTIYLKLSFMLVKLRCRHEKENLLFQRHFFIPISILYDYASITKKK
jgi:hypothetical protein